MWLVVSLQCLTVPGCAWGRSIEEAPPYLHNQFTERLDKVCQKVVTWYPGQLEMPPRLHPPSLSDSCGPLLLWPDSTAS